MSDKITTLHLKNDPSTNIYPNVKMENIPLDVTIAQGGANLATSGTIYEFTTSQFLSLNGGTMNGKIMTGGFASPEEAVLGDGLDVSDLSSPAEPVTHYGGGYIRQGDDEDSSIKYEYKFPKKSGTFALKEELEELKSLVYSLHSLTYNSYEFGYLTSSVIPDEVDGRKVVSGSHAIIDWVGGNSVVTNDEIKSTIISKIESHSTEGVKLGEINIPNAPLRLDGVNDIHNTLTFEKQSDGSYNAILTKKIGIVDLGTLNWGTPNSNGWVPSETIPAKPNESSSTMPNAICDKYQIGTPDKAYTTDGYASLSTGSYLTVRDSSFIGKTRDEIKAMMSGVHLLFELATPTTETIATGLTFDKASFPIEKGGTIKAVYDEVPPTISVNFMTKGE